ncbi:MAG TPA: hypothetical protein VJ246_00165, partial [Patescibacteria group bacterium]|nr:hypothetical protein [Patescibacteria group bacterium]
HATAEAIVKAMGEAVSPDGGSLSPEYIKKLLTSANGRLPNNLHRRLKKSELKALDDAMHNFIVWRAFDSLLDTEP